MTGIEVGEGPGPRIGEVYLDAENLFHGFLAAPRDPTVELIQDELFEPPIGARAEENAVARMQRVLGGIIRWFERGSGCSIANITSAGKAEATVKKLLHAMSDAGDPRFSYHGVGNKPWTSHEFWIANRIKVVHTMVPEGKDVADLFLIDRFNEQLPKSVAGTAFLAGSADDLVLSRFDLALGERGDPDATDAVIDVWAVLPVHEDPARRWDVVDKFGALGVYPHIPRDNVRFIAQMSGPDAGWESFDEEWARRNAERFALLDAADEAAGPIGTGDDAGAVSDAARPLASVLALQADLLDGAAPDAPGWRAALGDPWTADAVSSNVSRVIKPSELVRYRAGKVTAERLLDIVWLCAVLRVIEDDERITAAQLRTFVSALDDPRPSWRWKRAATALHVLIAKRLIA